MTRDRYPLPDPDELVRSYYVDLLYAEAPDLLSSTARDRISAALRRLADGEVRVASGSPDADGASAGSPPALRLEYAGPLRDVGEPPEWRVRAVPSPSSEEMARHLGQSWWWQEAAAAIAPATATVRLSDHRHLSLDGASRIRRFRRVLAAVILAAPPLAVVWTPTQQLVEPRELLDHLAAHGYDDPLPGAINVRFFQVERDGGSAAADREMVMDTLGLSALGLTDLQCHFRGLDPEEVASTLYNTALYLLAHGPVIQEGATVQGPGANDRWGCTRRRGLCEPQREVLDLDPGFPFNVKDEEAP